ncbi:MAG: hypothetical protein IIC35_07795, partial [Gemmatimonadetes bacterium]|nr:hypothetical protein [Gemmatimonadota bacterium]
LARVRVPSVPGWTVAAAYLLTAALLWRLGRPDTTTTEAGATSPGRLAAVALVLLVFLAPPAVGAASELAGLVDREWEALTAHAFTGLCPTAYDGSEVVYTVRRIPQGEAAVFAYAEVRELASCTYDLGHPDAHAAILRLRELWRALDLPE